MLTSEGIWLLDLTIGGRVFRFATEPVEVEDVNGHVFTYAEGLTEVGLSFGAVAGVGDASVAIEVQAEGTDWAEIVQRGHALDRQPAVVRRWHAGRTIERARVVLSGLTAEPSYGAMGEPLTVSIVRSLRSQTRVVPPPQATVDDATWPVTTASVHITPENALGAVYPLVIGAPGGTEDPTPVCVVPVPQAEYRSASLGTSKVVWLGGHATQVRLQLGAADPPTDSDEAVAAVGDLLGREVQYALPGDSDEDGTYYVGFRDDATYGGGILSFRGGLLRGAGDVIEWVLRQHYDGAVDWGRLEAVRAYLNNWKIDTYINSPVNGWDWLEREILPLLPVEMREGAYGIYPAVMRFDVTRRDAVAHLDATPGSGRVTRASMVSHLADQIVNEITVEYRPGAESGSTWLARRVLTARPGAIAGTDSTEGEDARVIGSYLCAESQRRYGVRPARIQAGAVWDTATAVLIAQHTAFRSAWARRSVRYQGGPWLEEIEIGATVTLTDPELHLDGTVAIVADVIPGADVAIDLILLDHPVDQLRATS